MTSVRVRRSTACTSNVADSSRARGASARRISAASSTGDSKRVRMQKVCVAVSPDWAFSRMLAPSSSRPWAMLATIPGRSGHASVRMCMAI